MADCEESTPVTPEAAPNDKWAYWQPWKTTFLYHITDPEVRRALEVLGGQIYEWALAWEHWPDEDSPERPLIVVELRSVAEELRNLQTFLTEDVSTPTDSRDRKERRLGVQAEDWCTALGRIADEIEAAIAAQ